MDVIAWLVFVLLLWRSWCLLWRKMIVPIMKGVAHLTIVPATICCAIVLAFSREWFFDHLPPIVQNTVLLFAGISLGLNYLRNRR